MGSTYGNAIKISIFGESHGSAIGVTIDGFPSGIAYDEDFVLREMARRAPGQNKQSTARKEPDLPRVVSGLYEGKTTGTPLCAIIENTNQRSGDYAALADQPRPSHADHTGSVRYKGFGDLRGGGHFSGRLTAPLVFAGALCKLYLAAQGITVGGHIARLAGVSDIPFSEEMPNAEQLSALRMQDYAVLDQNALTKMLDGVEQARMAQDSVGGAIECAVLGLPCGIGSPMLDTVEGRIAALLFGVPAVKAVSFGDGFALCDRRGSEVNDALCIEQGEVRYQSNHNGGVLGGITNGMPLLCTIGIKPTPSIAAEQQTLRLSTGKVEPLSIHGRHDPCIVVRAVPVIEAAVAIAVADLMREARGYA